MELKAYVWEMRALAAEGVLLLRGTVQGEDAARYCLVYRDAVLETGTAERIVQAIKRICQEGKAGLAGFLERLYVTKTGTGGGFNYLTEVESTRMV